MANGLLYLDSSMGECCPLDFSQIPSGSTPFIAPFWVDSDPSVRGNVSYEVHPSPCSPLVQLVSDYISVSEGVDFCGTWMMVAYWWDMPELFLDYTVSQFSTFVWPFFACNCSSRLCMGYFFSFMS